MTESNVKNESQQKMFEKRKKKIESRNGWTEEELIKHANNPKNYRRKHK